MNAEQKRLILQLTEKIGNVLVDSEADRSVTLTVATRLVLAQFIAMALEEPDDRREERISGMVSTWLPLFFEDLEAALQRIGIQMGFVCGKVDEGRMPTDSVIN